MLKIRPAQLNDATSMIHAHREAVFAGAGNHYSQAILEAWSPGTTPDRVARMEQQISDPTLIILVAEYGADIVGFALVNTAINELGAVYVKPNSIGGVGRTLLAEVEKRAFAIVEFLTCDASLNAETFYKANGYTEEFRTTHTLKTGPTMPCIRMKKIRAPAPN
jgi:hypothetical protein